MPAAKQQDNEFLGKEMKYFSQAGFDLDRIHIKVSFPLLNEWPELIW
jgi:phosphoenolpyruvate carboxykinase (ATP)